MLRSGYVVAKDVTVDIVESVLLDFPRRYKHYYVKNSKSIWNCNFIKRDNENIVLQLVDKNFEPPKGNVKSDAPIFYISFEQSDKDVLIKYHLQWKKWKRVFVSVISILCALICLMYLFYAITNPVLDEFILLGLWLLAPLMLIVWMIKNKKHDDLTMCTFIELLNKNFKIVDRTDSTQKNTV